MAKPKRRHKPYCVVALESPYGDQFKIVSCHRSKAAASRAFNDAHLIKSGKKGPRKRLEIKKIQTLGGIRRRKRKR